MSKKILLILILINFLLIVHFISADEEIYFGCGNGDNQTRIGCFGDNQTFSTSMVPFQNISERNVTNITITNITIITTSGGGGATRNYECTNNSQCSGGAACFDFKCVKMFDIKIINFTSPAELGTFFDLTYFVKNAVNSSGDVRIDFWISGNGQNITSGSDTIYLGAFENETETAQLFLPNNFRSGIYDFFISISSPAYTAMSQRTIEIQVTGNIVNITPVDITAVKNYIILSMILLAIIISLIIIIRETRKAEFEMKFFKKHKKSIFVCSFILILGLISYLTGLYEYLALFFLRVVLWFKAYSSYFYYAIALVAMIILFIKIIKNRTRWAQHLNGKKKI